MAELTIRPEDVRSALDEFVASYKPAQVAAEEVGHVVFAADGREATGGEAARRSSRPIRAPRALSAAIPRTASGTRGGGGGG
mgnify:CR=1 FL=1